MLADTLRFNKQNKPVSGHLAETFRPSCRLKVSTGILVSHRVREEADISYSQGTSWHRTISSRKLIFHSVNNELASHCDGAEVDIS